MTITPRFLDELRARITLSELISRKVKITRAGREFKGCCPFHKEKTPSFYVNDDKQFFHCFGCGAHGDAVGFVMRHDNLSFPEAVEQLAAQAGMQVPKQAPEDVERAKTEKSLYTLMEMAASWFEAQLHDTKHQKILDYIAGRGLREETLAGFRLGYAPGDDQALRKYLNDQGYTDEQMVVMGLIKKSENKPEPYCFFRDRVMFPVADRAGRIIAFGGRIVPDHLRPADRGDFKPAKYINSPETPLFHKGQSVYAQALARQAARDGHGVVVVEGYMDAIACHQAGFKGTVAPLGTALTEEQIVLLWRMIVTPEKTITLCFDGDEAGRRAAVRAADRILPLLKPDHSARIAFLPQGEDPDTLIQKQGKTAFAEILKAGVPLAEFLWQTRVGARALDRPEDRAGLESELDQVSARITDAKIQHYYRDFFRAKLRDQFRPAPQPFVKGGGRGPLAPAIKPVSPQKLKDQSYDILLATILNHPEMFAVVDEEIGSIEIPDAGRDRLRQEIVAALSAAEFESGAELQDEIRQRAPDLTPLISRILADATYLHARFARADADLSDAHQGWADVMAQIQRRYHIMSTGRSTDQNTGTG